MSKGAVLFTTGAPFSRIVRIVMDALYLTNERRDEITTPIGDDPGLEHFPKNRGLINSLHERESFKKINPSSLLR